ncbi:MAG: hypothetical protein J1G06_07425 [Oscillospiraceae bacterium]|nr:hypothetical protein [Oscillospiraceae bacterium]
MTEEEKLAEAVDIILENILTPIIYMYIDEVVEFIVFCDSETPSNVFRRTEDLIFFNLGLRVEITELREFDEGDRVDIAESAYIVYAENEFMPTLFETAMNTDIEMIQLWKNELLKRKTDTGTYYMS